MLTSHHGVRLNNYNVGRWLPSPRNVLLMHCAFHLTLSISSGTVYKLQNMATKVFLFEIQVVDQMYSKRVPKSL
ncbi:hypothetical protein CEXT_670671 [Caerostris extrusa]|uniref:Uncharacterized protein n=1 Tax=Caerostris extrusa TaxID=172846 RepID=A0AAV4QSX9_CAEEX|nr:hypothetical protein CEXT_670671 [Caerostris extrusa]